MATIPTNISERKIVNYFTDSFINNQTGTPCDIFLRGQNTWTPGIIKIKTSYTYGKDKFANYIIYTNFGEFAYTSLHSFDPSEIILPAGTHALEMWKDFDWLSSDKLKLLNMVPDRLLATNLVAIINPLRLSVASIIGRKGDLVFKLYNIWHDYLCDYKLITIDDYINLFPEDTHFVLKWRNSNLSLPNILFDPPLVMRRASNFLISVDLIKFVIEHKSIGKRYDLLNSYLVYAADNQYIASWLLDYGADICVLLKYMASDNNNINCLNNLIEIIPWICTYIDKLKSIKMFCEVEILGVIMPRDIFNIITCYISWYNFIKLNSIEEYLVKRINGLLY